MRLFAYGRLVNAGYVLAREGAFSLIDLTLLPTPARLAIKAIRLVERRSVRQTGRVERLTKALNRLGPTYVKFGQLLGARPDIVGDLIASDLSALQDRMPPFDQELVPTILASSIGDKAQELFNLTPPVAAASIAQVHKAEIRDSNGHSKTVAVKILRPDVRARFGRDLESFYAGAALAEALVPPLRRLKPLRMVETLDQSTRLELDLRFEAAAMSEFAQNTKDDDGFDIPDVNWDYVSGDVLTTDWIDAVPIRDTEALDKAGIDKKKLATHLMQSFLRHAIRDGFFHADMHPGNLFADPQSHGVIAIDFGITGRISAVERKFLADTLYGFITRDYRLVARRHFEIGYVPANQSIDDFTLALRSIGEPLQGRLSREISMARVLGQLFAVTDMFDMEARPELLLLQKNMVLVEGVARALDPDLNIWDIAKPVVQQWLQQQAGPAGQFNTLKTHFETFTDALGQIPLLVDKAQAIMSDYEAEVSARRARHERRKKWAAILIFAAILGVIIWKVI